jgi:FMN reductase
MKNKIKITGIGGSLEKKSVTFAALKYTMEELKSLGAEVSIYDLKNMKLPVYNPAKGIKQGGGELKSFLENIHTADGYIFASPEYHGTISGAFKNILDYLEYLSAYNPPYLTHKPVGAIATGGGDVSGATTLQTIVHIIHSFRGISASGNVAINSSHLHFDNNEIKSEIIKGRLKRLASEVFSLALKLK